LYITVSTYQHEYGPPHIYNVHLANTSGPLYTCWMILGTTGDGRRQLLTMLGHVHCSGSRVIDISCQNDTYY